jgi:hypothetical protein
MSGAPAVNPKIAEWNEARSVINKIDDRLNDLRKYGLTFVSGLLTAQALIDSSTPSAATFVTAGVKLAIILASLVLICALFVIEIINRQVQHAVSSRARQIEKDSNLGLTRAVARAFAIYRVDRTLDLLYLMMIVATGVLGFYVLGGTTFPSNSLANVGVLASIVAGLFLLGVHALNRLAMREFDVQSSVRSAARATIESAADGPALLVAYEACCWAVRDGRFTAGAERASEAVTLAIAVRGRRLAWPLAEWSAMRLSALDRLQQPLVRGDVPRRFSRRLTKLMRVSDERRILRPHLVSDWLDQLRALEVQADLTRLLNGWFVDPVPLPPSV